MPQLLVPIIADALVGTALAGAAAYIVTGAPILGSMSITSAPSTNKG